MREELKKRLLQPGHDKSFWRSEHHVNEILCEFEDDEITIIPNPKIGTRDLFSRVGRRYWEEQGWSQNFLDKCFSGVHGNERFEFDFGIEHKNIQTGCTNTIFGEIKKQNDNGNAQERVYRTTPLFRSFLISHAGAFPKFPCLFVFCESLANNGRYLRKFMQTLDPRECVFLPDYTEKSFNELRVCIKDRIDILKLG